MKLQDLPFLSATELGELIQRKQVSPVEAVDAYLRRIDVYNETLSAYITVCREEARAAARQAEKEIAAGDSRGPLHGVPMAVKDQFNTQGIPTTGGSSILRNNVPSEDATVIARLKEAGAILLGKLNMSEFASGDAFHHPYGRPRNPWDLRRNPGTSSSGSGAATAAFLCATSLGEDTGGSIRGPAAFCGLVGIRPTWGLVSRYGMLGASWSMDIGGPISRTVTDCAITLQAIAGHDPKDPHTASLPAPDYRPALSGDIRGLKIAVIRERIDTPDIDPEVNQAVRRAAALLGELGANVAEVSIPLIVHSAVISSTLIMAEAAGLHRQTLREHLAEYDHNNQVRLLAGSVLPAQVYQKVVKLRHLLRRQILAALQGVDALLLPTSSVPATMIPEKAGIASKQEVIDGFGGRRSYTNPFNLASVPALSINCGFTSETLPVGLQLVGKPFDESALFRLAYAYEQATDWHNRRPPI